MREGLDLPEVSLVGILDADKEGYLRSGTSLIQTIGRASRNVEGKVIMYADVVTESMARAIGETRRRREMQLEFNREHGIEPKSVRKEIHDILSMVGATGENTAKLRAGELPRDVATKMARDLERKMRDAAAGLEFEKAAALRDELIELRKADRRQRSRSSSEERHPRSSTRPWPNSSSNLRPPLVDRRVLTGTSAS